eukprot:TRINITY_DN3722_c0_g1_i7.p1 TRINITY_DN3722_c0_g1~~TRINITY_DN3722_c0_g1_i7.p1  ORF type:complete len:460 (+),score=32.70 TRINITY_DN3722_c0_g1_i7:159-1538(+)
MGLALKLLLIALSCIFLRIKQTSAYLGTSVPLRIDCGATTTSTVSGLTWEPDNYFAEGSSAYTLSANSSISSMAATLRAFSSSSSGCYTIPRPEGRYLVRLGFFYGNYDSKDTPPLFDVYLQDVLVETIRTGSYGASVYYTDYIAYAPSGSLSVCLRAESGLPFINTLEVLPCDTDAYDGAYLGNVILSSYLRINLGGPGFGPEPADPGFRTWRGDVSPGDGNYTDLSAIRSIVNTGVAPDYLPQTLFKTARQAQPPANATGLSLKVVPVNPTNSWYVRYYFAELDPLVSESSRMFILLLGTSGNFQALGSSKNGFSIIMNNTVYSAVSASVTFSFTAYAENYGQDLELGVQTLPTSPLQAIISGLEVFEIIPAETSSSTSGSSNTGSSSTGAKGSKKKGSDTGLIVGIVVGVLGAALLACGLFVFCCSKSRKSRSGLGMMSYERSSRDDADMEMPMRR